MNVVTELLKLTRQTFGAETSASVARAVAFGHKDNCVIFSGPRCAEAAKAFAKVVTAQKITDRADEFLGMTSLSTAVEW